jgi:CheY-like chemotaxis protein
MANADTPVRWARAAPTEAEDAMGKTVLVVDDDPDVVTYVCALLHDNGYETLEAFNGDEAVALAERHRPDLVTLDITMPETSGVRAYRALRENEALRRIPVVILTGISHDFKRFISTRPHLPPPDGYLEKPLQAEEFLAEVRKHVGASPAPLA